MLYTEALLVRKLHFVDQKKKEICRTGIIEPIQSMPGRTNKSIQSRTKLGDNLPITQALTCLTNRQVLKISSLIPG